MIKSIHFSRSTNVTGCRLSTVSLSTCFSAQTDENLHVPFIKSSLILPDLEINYTEHIQYTGFTLQAFPWQADCWRCFSAHPLALRQRLSSSPSAYGMRHVPVLAQKERQRLPAGLRGLGITVSTPTARYHSFLHCFLFMFYHPTPIFKEGRALSLAPTICLIGCICVIVTCVRLAQISLHCTC